MTPSTTSSAGATYGFYCKPDDNNFAHVVTRATEALKAEGFGVLTDIDVQATMKTKLWDPLESTCRHASLSIL